MISRFLTKGQSMQSSDILRTVGQNIKQVVDFNDIGEVAERLNAPVLKTGVPSQEP
jgi:hypothetical protein